MVQCLKCLESVEWCHWTCMHIGNESKRQQTIARPAVLYTVHPFQYFLMLNISSGMHLKDHC